MTLRTGALFSILALFSSTACLSIDLQHASTSGGQGSGGSASSGQGSAGNSAGGSTTGQCIVGETPDQIGPCDDAGLCGCPLVCASDPSATPLVASGRVCEGTCRTDADCNILSACLNGLCALAGCGADAGNGTYAFACAMGDEAGLGSCFVGQLTDAGRFSYCVAGGISDGGCDPNSASRSKPASLCPPGYLCSAPPAATVGTCQKLCDNVTTLCPAGQSCSLQLKSPPYWGYCQ